MSRDELPLPLGVWKLLTEAQGHLESRCWPAMVSKHLQLWEPTRGKKNCSDIWWSGQNGKQEPRVILLWESPSSVSLSLALGTDPRHRTSCSSSHVTSYAHFTWGTWQKRETLVLQDWTHGNAQGERRKWGRTEKTKRKVALLKQSNSTGKGDISTSKGKTFWWPEVIFKHCCPTHGGHVVFGNQGHLSPTPAVGSSVPQGIMSKTPNHDLSRLQSHFGDRMMMWEWWVGVGVG